MDDRKLTPDLAVASQLSREDIALAAKAGYKSIVCNRPDGEAADQPSFAEIDAAAREAGLTALYLPIIPGKLQDSDTVSFAAALETLPRPILAYCRTGTRSTSLWSLVEAKSRPLTEILQTTREAGYDMSGLARRIANKGAVRADAPDLKHDIVVVGGGAAGLAVASSLLARRPNLDVLVIDPAETHYYQPGWTMVGAGIFSASSTTRDLRSVVPKGAKHLRAAVTAFEPDKNSVILEGCRVVQYNHLVVCPGLKLDWNAIEGLSSALGTNGVTSNYRYDLAPYTWQCVQDLKGGRAIFTQPPMPIKCAGAPQKAMYLSADHWRRTGRLKNIQVRFCSAGNTLFGVEAFVPPLMHYIRRYDIDLQLSTNLVSVDGPRRAARFSRVAPNGRRETIDAEFELLHVAPPQRSPDFVSVSPLADSSGWLDVDHFTLRHRRFANVFGLGDVTATPNAKTAAAVRKQAPVVAHNLLVDLGFARHVAKYDGYGSCPLTVEHGKILLAEFGYGGVLKPSLPRWIIDGQKPSRNAWRLKERVLPQLYWHGMLRGREWLARPRPSD